MFDLSQSDESSQREDIFSDLRQHTTFSLFVIGLCESCKNNVEYHKWYMVRKWVSIYIIYIMNNYSFYKMLYHGYDIIYLFYVQKERWKKLLVCFNFIPQEIAIAWSSWCIRQANHLESELNKKRELFILINIGVRNPRFLWCHVNSTGKVTWLIFST